MLSLKAQEQIKAMLETAMQNKELAGANVLVLKDGEEIFYHEAGYSHIKKGEMIQRDSIFKLYSMTKPVTAVAAMILMERGIIDLYDAVDKYLPGFKNQKVAVDKGLENPKRSVNLMDLLGMTSGLVYGGENLSGWKTYELGLEIDRRLLSENPMTTLEAMNAIGNIPLTYHPGEAWDYGTSADVLGAVIEVASGKTFGEFLQDELFGPLGMVDTGFYVPEDKQNRFTTTYERYETDGEVKLRPFAENHLGIINAMDRKPAFESGGAGLVSTIDDYARFATMLMQGGSLGDVQILRPKTVAYLTTKVLTEQQQSFFKNWHTLAGHSYGNLMRIVTEPEKAGTLCSFGEYGWDGWLGCYFANCPEDELTFLLMMQMKDSGTTTATRKLRNIVISDLG